MRMVVGSCFLIVGLVSLSPAQEVKFVKRHGVSLSENDYPQKTPKECLDSVIKAIEMRKIDYLLAHLADPDFIDDRARTIGFPEVVKEATAKLADDPGVIKELKRFAREGEWDKGEEATSVRLKDNKFRIIFLKKIKERWYMENRQKPAPPKDE
ncbi:MAG: hypothetical protein AB7K24_20045 [Gemmataceae bacterium]